MASYIFILHMDDEDVTRSEVDCDDDMEALLTAEHLTQLCDVDVWKDSVVLGSLKRRVYFAKLPDRLAS